MIMLASSGRAHADITQSVYDDVKNVIEDVVSDEVAQQVVPRVVCYARNVAPDPEDKFQAPKGKQLTKEEQEKEDEAYDDLHAIVTINKTRLKLEALYFYPQTLQRIYARQLGSIRTSILDESAELAGAVMLDALRNKGAIGTLANDPVTFSDDDMKTCTDYVHSLFENGTVAKMTSSPLDERCEKVTTGSDRFQCQLAQALRSGLQGKEAVAEDHLIKATSIVLSQRLDGVSEAEMQELEERTILLLRDLFQGKSTDDAVAALLADVKKLVTDNAKFAAIETQINGLKTAIERLRVQWRVATLNGTATVDVGTFIDLISNATGSLEGFCTFKKQSDGTTVASPEVCADLSRLRGAIAKISGLWAMVQAAAKKDYAEAAHRAFAYLFSRAVAPSCSKQQQPDPQCRADAFEHFIEAFAQYVIEAAQTGDTAATTRAAFRAAAVQVIRVMSVGGGFNRPGWEYFKVWIVPVPVHPRWSFVIPDVALRLDWSSGFVNQSTHNYRYTASLSLLSFRPIIRVNDQTYAAIHFSLLDPLSPLSELSIRNNNKVTFAEDDELFWNIFSPRIELVYGRPSLSKHLALTAGLTLHPVAPIPDDMSKTSYTYKTFAWDLSADNKARFVEFGFALKYVL